MILSGCLFLVYFCSCTVHSQTRASVLYCLLSQTDRSLDSQTRATALHRLLSQAVCSLMTQEKQMPPFKRGEIRKQAKTLISSRFKDSGQTGYK